MLPRFPSSGIFMKLSEPKHCLILAVYRRSKIREKMLTISWTNIYCIERCSKQKSLATVKTVWLCVTAQTVLCCFLIKPDHVFPQPLGFLTMLLASLNESAPQCHVILGQSCCSETNSFTVSCFIHILHKTQPSLNTAIIWLVSLSPECQKQSEICISQISHSRMKS